MGNVLTIKRNIAFDEISAKLNRQPDELAGVIVFMAKKGVIWVDMCEFAGDRLFSLFEDEAWSLSAATLYCLGQSDPMLDRLFSDLVLWGTAGECPLCGCELSTEGEYMTSYIDGSKIPIWEETTCMNPNCDYVERTENEPDPDRFQDEW